MPLVDKYAKDVTMHYRNAVGPGNLYDVIGALQFQVMIDQGLRDWHYLCDIGCGSLRGGRLFIVYLRKGRYYGIEPNKFLVGEGIRAHFGPSIHDAKVPNFYYSPHCDLGWSRQPFDYILAQSIFSHAPRQLIRRCMLEAAGNLAPGGKFVATYFKGAEDYQGKAWARQPDARYTEGWMRAACANAGLTYEPLGYPHPCGQTWFMMERRK